MSIEAAVTLTFGRELIPSIVVQGLINGGWQIDPGSGLSVLSPSNVQEGDWETLDGTNLDSLVNWAKQLDGVRGGLGFVLIHSQSGIGGPFLFDDERKELFFGISINIPRILEERALVDFSKCAQVLIENTGLTTFQICKFEASAQ